MYIKKVIINNIRSIEHFEMEFEAGKEAGWHVLIGDNGAGKSTVVQSIALALIGEDNSKALRLNLSDWLSNLKNEGSIKLEILRQNIDKIISGKVNIEFPISDIIDYSAWIDTIKITKKGNAAFEIQEVLQAPYDIGSLTYGTGWFSCSFGPFRRFTGGDKEWNVLYKVNNIVASHLSVFGENTSLTVALDWLQDLNYKSLDGKDEATETLEGLTRFINETNLLPNGEKLQKINSDGIFFKDGNDNIIPIHQLSDGFRSVLSLTFELFRQLNISYPVNIWKELADGKFIIDLPGVVLIDEIDAHLHPTWQTRIGQWFTQYFPNIQFIVTTHSPLVCRACEKGSIWRLRAPGDKGGNQVEEIKGTDRDRLIFGNVLDAYGTEVFGNNVSQSEEGEKMLKELADLNLKSFKGKTLTEGEKQRIEELKKILPTEA